MEKPADQTDRVPVINAVDTQSPDRKVVRRRFVQSTLFPLKSHDTKVENSVKKEKKKVEEIVIIRDDGDKCCGSQERSSKGGRKSKRNATPQKRASKVVEIVDDHDGDEEYCGSQERSNKRGRKSKPNATPQTRASKKIVTSGNNASVIALDDIESPDDGSPQKLKDKKHVSVQNGRTRGNKGASTAKAPTLPITSLQASQHVSDLWLEAKRTAEENSRLFAGKKMHPFFSACKAGKKDQVTIEVENNGCLGRTEGHAVFGPIHVFENVQVDVESIDWSNWTLCDGLVGSATISSFEATVGSLNSSIDLNTSNPSAPLGIEDVFMGQCHGAHDYSCIAPTFDSPVIIDEEVAPCDLLKNMKKDFEMNKLGFVAGDVDNASSTSEQPKTVLLESIIKSYYLNRDKHPENSLWTNKYQPEKALEVCGNSEAVKSINEWLHLWHSTGCRVNRRPSIDDMCLMREDAYDSYGSDSDMENADKSSGLKNVLLVTGPVGSGKSAAIYACAKEQGFHVIEVNASDWRSGALLKQKFGEAVVSHRLKRSQETPMISPSKLNLKASAAVCTNSPAALDLNKSVFEVISLSEEECDDEMQCNGDSQIPCEQNEIKTVILFEDVDATLCEDRGFISTIQQLANTGKRPMILTCNSENPALPNSLAREQVYFTMPPLKELIHHIYMVCAAEKVNVQPYLIERCIHFCGGDIRKTLTHLQFWCQRKGSVQDWKMRTLYSPLMFDLLAGYYILPRLFPWELPSSLSVFVEAEIAYTLGKISIKENDSLLEVIEEEVGNTSMENNLDFDQGAMASIEAKKEEILRKNCFQHVDDDIIAMRNMCDFSNFSDSPITFARRNVRRKLGTVLSDSEDEIPAVSGGLGGVYNSPVPVDEFSPNLSLAVDGTSHALDDQLFHSRAVEELKLPSGIYNSPVPVDKFSPILSLAVNGTSNALDDQLFHSRAVEELKLPSGIAHLSHINFSPGGNSCKLNDHHVHYSEANFEVVQHQHMEQSGVNYNSRDAANHTLDLLSGQSLYAVQGKLEANDTLFPLGGMANQNLPSVSNLRNQSSDQTIHFFEANAMETEMGNEQNCKQEAGDHYLTPSNEGCQNYRELQMAVKRCLFPRTLQVDSTDDTGNILQNQSSDQLINREKLNMTELPHQHLGAGLVNLSCQVATDYLANSVIPQFLSLGQATMEKVEHKHPDTANVSTFSSAAVDGYHPGDHLLHSVEEQKHEIQNQYSEAEITRQMPCTGGGDSLNQLSNRFVGITKLEEILPGSADVKHVCCPLEDSCLKQASHQLPYGVEKIENQKHQSPEIVGLDVTSYTILGNATNPVDGKVLQFAEEHQHSEVIVNGCLSQDISCVPESTFVPETEVYDELEFPLGDLMEIVSPVTNYTVGPSILKHKISGYVERCSDINLNARSEEMGDSQTESEHLEASTSGCQVMDECSRMDFFKRSKSFRRFRLPAKNPVQEKWNELRQTDLRQHFISEHKNAHQVLELAYGMSNLFSDADLLLHPCRFFTNDSLDQEISLGEEISNFGWHDQQVEMVSAIAEHGYCFYAKNIDSLQLPMGTNSRLHLAWELLASTNHSMALGKLLRLGRSKDQSSLADGSFKGVPPTVDNSLNRETETCLQNMVLSIIPLRSHLAVRGNALHDYLSSMALISSAEASRMTEAAEKRKGRRVRVAKNYLSSGGLDLSSDDISLLNQYKSHGRVPPSSK